MTDGPAARPPLDSPRLSRADWAQIEVLDAVPSTNALVVERARAGGPDGLVVVTEHQTAGRGRLDRTWQTPARAALTFSVLCRPRRPAHEWPWLPLLSGYAVSLALRGAGFDAGVKWPNDVLIADRKVAGILVERVETSAGAAAVIGIGLNVSSTADELPVETATSLALEGRAPDRTDLLLAILGLLQAEYDGWQRAGPVELRTTYTRACVTLGREVRVDLPSGEQLTGQATGIDQGGRLLVQGSTGEMAVGAGDVVHVRSL